MGGKYTGRVEQLQLAYTTLNVFLRDFTLIILEENVTHLHDFSSFNCSRLALFSLTRMFDTGADPGKNLTVANFVRPSPPPGKFLKSSPILKQYLMHFEGIFLSKKDKISVI